MFIETVISQHRRDITVVMKCPSCGYKIRRNGYDDDYYHIHVVPKMVCPGCGKTAGKDYIPRTPKYHDNIVI